MSAIYPYHKYFVNFNHIFRNDTNKRKLLWPIERNSNVDMI